MTWLIWKEYRLNRLVLIVGLGLLLLPHMGGAIATYFEPRRWMEIFGGTSVFSLAMAHIVFAFLGGNAFAGERVDRSAEFLACLPYSRQQNLVSKLVLAPAVWLVMWSVNGPVLWLTESLQSADTREMLGGFACITIVALLLFGISWLASSLLESAVFSVCLGLIVPFAVYVGMVITLSWLHLKPKTPEGAFIAACCVAGFFLALALGSLITGAWCYLRRVEP